MKKSYEIEHTRLETCTVNCFVTDTQHKLNTFNEIIKLCTCNVAISVAISYDLSMHHSTSDYSVSLQFGTHKLHHLLTY